MSTSAAVLRRIKIIFMRVADSEMTRRADVSWLAHLIA